MNKRGPSWRRESADKSFAELILESPMKMPGDAPFETLKHMSKSVNGMKDDFTFIETYKDVKIYKHNKLDWIVAGIYYHDANIDKELFGIVGEISYTHQPFRSTANKILKQRDAVSVDTVHVEEAARRANLASEFYKILLRRYNVMSDKLQYEKAALLWKKFASETDNVIYIYDANEDKIISKMSGKTPDSHVWSSDTSKMKIRMIMVDAS